MITTIAIYLGIVLVMSLACFVAYGWDKRSAANGCRRVPEQTLHIMALLGGWPGALLGQRYFSVVALHVAIVGSAAYVFFGNPGYLALERTSSVMGYRSTIKPIDGRRVDSVSPSGHKNE